MVQIEKLYARNIYNRQLWAPSSTKLSPLLAIFLPIFSWSQFANWFFRIFNRCNNCTAVAQLLCNYLKGLQLLHNSRATEINEKSVESPYIYLLAELHDCCTTIVQLSCASCTTIAFDLENYLMNTDSCTTVFDVTTACDFNIINCMQWSHQTQSHNCLYSWDSFLTRKRLWCNLRTTIA